MADYLNTFPLKHFAGIAADALELPLPEPFAPTIPWVSRILKARLGGRADRAVLYHADAVGLYIWQKYTNLFAPVYAHSSMAIPFRSTVESVTPVAHASMYTGQDPEGHGIMTYVRPQLTCTTLYDVAIAAGLKPAIVAQTDSTFLHIFAGRDMPYFEEPNAVSIQQRVLDLMAEDKYDIISVHTFEYDSAAHAYGPESKEALNALSLEAEGYSRIADFIGEHWGGHRTLLTYSPDHGQHLTDGGTGSHGSTMIEDMNVLHFFETL